MNYREELATYIWDEYKSVNGIRPRWMGLWNADGKVSASWTTADLKAEADRIEGEVKLAIIADGMREHDAAMAFEVSLLDIIDAGAKDRETAIRWLRDADVDYARDGYFEFCYGLRYGYLAEGV